MAAITNGAELTRKLRDSGTGEAKLAVCAKVLQDVHSSRNEVARSGEIILALDAAFPGSVTVEKAKQFAATGEYVPAVVSVVNVEDKFLGPRSEEAKDAVVPVVGPMSVHQGELEANQFAQEKAQYITAVAEFRAEAAEFVEHRKQLEADRAAYEAAAKALAEERAKLEADKAKAEEDAKKAEAAKGNNKK